MFLQPDIIATDSKVRKPFQWRGNLMVVVSTAGNGCVAQADAYRLTPVSLFKGTPTTYRHKTATEDRQTQRVMMPRGFITP